MKKILGLLFVALTSLCYSDSTTNRLHLTIPTIGSPTWGQKINGNFQILDATVTAQGTFVPGPGINFSTFASSTVISANGTSAAAIAVSQNGVVVSSPTRIINFVGSGVTVSLTGTATAQVTINGGGGSGGSPLEVFNNFNGARSSPTLSIGMSNAFAGSVSGSTFTFALNSSSVTMYGTSIPAAAIASGALGSSVRVSSLTTIVAPGKYGSSTISPVITINAQGQVISLSSAAISTGGSGASILAVGTGTLTNFTRNISSPTAAISALGSQFNVLSVGTTAILTLNSSSVTLAGPIGGNNASVQFSSAGTFGGSADFTYDNVNKIVAINSPNDGGLHLSNDGSLSSRMVPLFLDAPNGISNGFLGQGFVNGGSTETYFGASGYAQTENTIGLGVFGEDLFLPGVILSTAGYIGATRLTLSGKFGPAYPILMNATGTLDKDVYLINCSPTTNMVITLPNVTTASSPQSSRHQYIICKINSSTNTVSFLAGDSDILASPLSTLSLSTSQECVVVISSITGPGSDDGVWYQALYTKPNGVVVTASASTLAVGTGTASSFTTNVTSPTAVISALGSQFVSVANGTTNFLSLNLSSVTVEGKLVAGSNITLTPGVGTLTIAAAAGSVSSLAVGTGTASNFTTNISSPTHALSALGSQFDVLAVGTTAFLSLKNIATAGTYGSTTVAPVITINQYGQVTSLSSATISGDGSGSSIYGATSTPSFPVGFSASTGVFTNATSSAIINGGTIFLSTGSSAAPSLYSSKFSGLGFNFTTLGFEWVAPTSIKPWTYFANSPQNNFVKSEFSPYHTISTNGDQDVATFSASLPSSAYDRVRTKYSLINAGTVPGRAYTGLKSDNSAAFSFFIAGSTNTTDGLSPDAFIIILSSDNASGLPSNYGNVGIGINAPTARLSIVGDIKTATDTAHPVPVLSSCGTSPSLSAGATDTSGKITVGGGVVTSCTLTFGTAKGKEPSCSLVPNTAITGLTGATSTTALTIGGGATFAGDIIMYNCLGNE